MQDVCKTYGFTHCHTEHSIYDSPLKAKDLVSRAKEMGAHAVSITDHGTCTGWIEFLTECKKQDIKGIVGVEAYVDSDLYQHAHLILLAKNKEGYRELSAAVTESNDHLESNGGLSIPIFTKDLLTKHFGNGNVIATSACVNGVLSKVLLGNKPIEAKIEKEEKKIPDDVDQDESKDDDLRVQLDDLADDLAYANDAKAVIECCAKKRFKKREMGLESLKKTADTPEKIAEYEKARAELEQDKKESEEAKVLLDEYREKIKQIKANITKLKKEKKVYEDAIAKQAQVNKKIEQLRGQMKTAEEARDAAIQEAKWYKDLFGDDFYIELQYHGMMEEAVVMPQLAEIANDCGIPLCASNDSHFASKEDAEARSLLESMRFHKWNETTDVDRECYMKSDRALSSWLSMILPKEVVSDAMDGTKRICDACEQIDISGTHHPRYRDEDGNYVEDAATLLKEKTYAAIPEKYPEGLSDENRKMLDYQLDTIINMGFADYILIVEDFVSCGKRYGRENPQGVGYSVGPGRGSGAGCLVNYLLGITTIDPIRYNLRFERFLNPERVSMPDIDIDFSEEVREKVRRYAEHKYGEESVAGIRTKITQGAKSAVRAGARLAGYESAPIESGMNAHDKNQQEEKRRQYKTLGDKISNAIPDTPGIALSDCEEELSAFQKDKEAQRVIRYAEEIEDVMTGVGVHAAGFIIADGVPLDTYVPILYNSSKEAWTVQCDKDEAEGALGLLKMDFLGLKNLDIISECIRSVKKNSGVVIDPDKIPMKKEVFDEVFDKGQTSCVFQLESGGMKQMLRDLRPQNLDDITLAVAVYRPGPMDFIPDIIDAKKGVKKPKYILPQLEKILAPTYGSPVYQEQIMDIFHDCAGFSMGEADLIRRAMAKKKEQEFLKYKPRFIEGFVANGAKERDAEEFWDSLVNFSRYAFNKSHAVVYAKVAYITAYLKYYYPGEYMSAVINHSLSDKLPSILYECRRIGLSMHVPDINRSMAVTEYRDGVMYYGLSQVKGVSGEADMIITEREADGPYQSFPNFLLRTRTKSNTVSALIDGGAFDEFYPSQRTALKNDLPQYVEIMKKIHDKEKTVDKIAESIPEDAKEAKSLQERKKNAEKAIKEQVCALKALDVPSQYVDDSSTVLENEKYVLGDYVSAHPLDAYRHVYEDKNVKLAEDFEPGIFCCAGIITKIHVVKKKGRMAFVTIEDPTGEIDVSIFQEQYVQYESLLREGNVIEVYGRAKMDSADQYNDKKMTAKKISLCSQDARHILISYKDYDACSKVVQPVIAKRRTKNGRIPILHDRDQGKILELEKTRVDPAILRDFDDMKKGDGRVYIQEFDW